MRVAMPRTVQLELLRPDEIIMERERCPVIFVPLGPLEWHSYHLPYGTDPLNAQTVARAVAQQTGGVVFPTLFWGTERERPPEKLNNLGFDEQAYIVGMDFPDNSLPSLYATEEFFGLLIRQVLELLKKLEYKLIVLVNGHGGRNHIEVLKRLCTEYASTDDIRVLLSFALPKNFSGIAGHAEAIETSAMMYQYPDSVDLGMLPPQSKPIQINTGIVDSNTFSGNPTPERTLPSENDPRVHATSQYGKKLLEESVSEISEVVEKTLGAIQTW
jgi:creatinine amidohydrolase